MKKIISLFNMCLAFVFYPVLKYKFRNRNIWLVGGNAGDLYVDNGRAVFEYLQAKKEIEAYWIINRDSPAYSLVKGLKIERGSIKAYLYFMNSKVVLFSHSVSADIVPYLFAVPLINIFHYKTIKVFLNHGTVGLKKRQPMNPKLEKMIEKLIKSYDINTADSELEKEIKHVEWKIDEKKIYITGSPRYDMLKNNNNKSKIFFMPTWRPWVKTANGKIEDTEYFGNITGLIKNEKLQNFLKEENLELNIYIHQLMHEYLNNFSSNIKNENITLLPKEADIQKYITTSDLLITDYSSMAFDFFYLDKPVIFFQFDKREYEEKVGSYIDLDKNLFGEQVFTIDDCTNKIIELYNNNFQMNIRYKKMKYKYFKYIDKHNSDRLFKIIEGELIGKR